ncbi:MAG: DUF952 domain-containing protein [Anaerolineales bacterium]
MSEKERVMGEMLVHICLRRDWERAVQTGLYRADSLDEIGFIHLSHPEQVQGVAERFYAGVQGLVLLWIDPKKLSAEIRWEQSDGQIFPHLYGPLNLEAVQIVQEFPPET